MTFLDSSVIIDYLDNVDSVVTFVDDETDPPYFTSAPCVYEVLMGTVHSSEPTDLQGERARFDWVNSLDLTESIGIEAARLQDQLKSTGDFLSPRDALVAATARSTGDHLVVADADFQTDVLESQMKVTNLRD